METNILLNVERIGNFTSSKIVKLTTNGKKEGELSSPAKTYIEEKNMEREFGLSLGTETNARPLSWGKLIEKRAFDLTGMEYVMCSNQTLIHPTIDFWSGSPDALKGSDTVCDFKAPVTRKSFHQLVKGGTIEYAREHHDDGDTYYWQLVSNSILTDSKYGELIVYMPYKSELADIREMSANYDGDQNKVAWIGFAGDEDLPYLKDGGKFKNLNVIRFEIPQADKDFLTERVKQAGKLLIDAGN